MGCWIHENLSSYFKKTQHIQLGLYLSVLLSQGSGDVQEFCEMCCICLGVTQLWAGSGGLLFGVAVVRAVPITTRFGIAHLFNRNLSSQVTTGSWPEGCKRRQKGLTAGISLSLLASCRTGMIPVLLGMGIGASTATEERQSQVSHSHRDSHTLSLLCISLLSHLHLMNSSPRSVSLSWGPVCQLCPWEGSEPVGNLQHPERG